MRDKYMFNFLHDQLIFKAFSKLIFSLEKLENSIFIKWNVLIFFFCTHEFSMNLIECDCIKNASRALTDHKRS